MKSFITIFLLVFSVSYGQAQSGNEVSFDLFDNAGVEIELSKKLDLSGVKYMVVSTAEKNIDIVNSTVTVLREGLGIATAKGDKIINIPENLRKNYKKGDKLLIEIKYMNNQQGSEKVNSKSIKLELEKL